MLAHSGGNYGQTRQTQYQETQAEHSDEDRGKEAGGKESHQVSLVDNFVQPASF